MYCDNKLIRRDFNDHNSEFDYDYITFKIIVYIFMQIYVKKKLYNINLKPRKYMMKFVCHFIRNFSAKLFH